MLLKKLYPNTETNKESLIISFLLAGVLYLLLIIYQPFGTYQFEHTYKYLLLFPYAIICAFSFYSIHLLLAKYKKRWTIGLEIAKSFIILLLISSLSYFYNTLFISKVLFSFENYLYMFLYTSALGIPVASIAILAKYIYLNKSRTSKHSTNMLIADPVIDSNTKHTESRLHIVADYANITFDIRQDDFIYAEAADNYCILYFYDNGMLRKEIIRISLTKLVSQIQTNTIRKVHRSFIVNLYKVTKFKGNTSGYKISLENVEKELSISRNYIDSVVPVLKNLAVSP